MGTLLSLFGVIPRRIGGAEAFARELSIQLAQYGWRSVLCFESAPPRAVGQYLTLPNVSFETLQSPERMRWDTLMNFLAILRRHQPDILHLHFVGFLGLYPLLARLCGVKRVYFTVHAFLDVPRRAPLWKRMLTRLINWPLSGVICVSAYGHKCMSALDVLPAARFHLIHNGVDTARAWESSERAREFRSKYRIPEGRSVVMQVGMITPGKGVADFLEAASIVVKENVHVQFVLVGDGESYDEYSRLAAKMGLEDHVTWTGLVEDPLAEGVFAAADVVCQVSRWQEMFSLTIVEAMACGKPMVATPVGGIPELVHDGKTGFLVPRGDPAGIADRILRLLAAPDLRERFGHAGRNVAVDKFDLKKNIPQLLRLYGLP